MVGDKPPEKSENRKRFCFNKVCRIFVMAHEKTHAIYKFDEFRWISIYEISVNAVSNVVVGLFGPVLCKSFQFWLNRILV